ncbi:hypothetical protein KTAU_06410 [Thermogemmatispora aurantia]|uniref:Uncharacterized protein n=1 Tax=Thermogemmatispora aurantia TaxID=2045279 RepID=A0A5J4K390_9CHLR|nr:hypothetical protein KTAU_06410 [Thermogemmatispora aurantia]
MVMAMARRIGSQSYQRPQPEQDQGEDQKREGAHREGDRQRLGSCREANGRQIILNDHRLPELPKAHRQQK